MTSSRYLSPKEYTRKVFRWAAEQGLTQIRLVIHQPKLGGPTEDIVSLDDLEAFAYELHLKADRVRVADAMYSREPYDKWWPIYLNPQPSEEACEWCRAAPVCPSMQAKLQRDAGADFQAVEEPDGEVIKTPPASLDAVSLSTAMKVVPVMENWCKVVRAEIERRCMAGETVPDFGLELGRQGNRRWIDPEQAEDYLRKTARLTIEDVYSLKLRSPTQIAKLIKPTKDPITGSIIPPLVGKIQWRRITEMVTRDDAVPSVKPLALIKVPWTPKPINDIEFTPVVEDDDLV